jgi:hypothetical protein
MEDIIMSNLSQFIGAGIPLGGSLQTMPYAGSSDTDIYTAPDGSQWYPNTSTSPFPYTSDYSYLPDHMTSPHSIMLGPDPETNDWFLPNTTFSIALNPTAPLYCTGTYAGSSTYYTSTDGSTWVSNNFPNSPIAYRIVQFTGGKFVAAATSTTTNGILISTDANSWSSYNSPSSFTPHDIISDNANNFIILGTSTTAVSSTNGGTTWSTRTLSPSPSSGQVPGAGCITWNEGAGLFLVVTTTAGTYLTSPTGVTWTSRSYSAELGAAARMASNATTTVVVGAGGFFATTTDGLTWSNYGFVSKTYGSSNPPNQVYYDGTRFVARWQQRVFYSTNGTTWTEGKNIGGFTLLIPQSGGTLFGFALLGTLVRTKMLAISDVTATTRQTVISPVLHVSQSTNHVQYRIR